jgi:DNA-binding phage protein
LSGERVPSGDTLLRVIHALGFRLGIQPQTTR